MDIHSGRHSQAITGVSRAKLEEKGGQKWSYPGVNHPDKPAEVSAARAAISQYKDSVYLCSSSAGGSCGTY